MSLEEKRAAFLPHLPDLAAFYETWLDAFSNGPERFFVTEALLDLELSGWRLINDDPKRYQKRYRRKYLPKGDLVRSYDSKSSRKIKNKVIQSLHRSGRVNALVKKRAKGLRHCIESQLLSRPIWAKSMKMAGLSRLDQDLIVNAVAASSACKLALISNDKALCKMVGSLRSYLGNPHWAPEGFEDQAQRLSQLKLQVYSWTWHDRQFLANALG